jgi:hypothetical protein
MATALLTGKTGMINCEEWAKMRPYMIMIDPQGKKDIFAQWSEACRWAGPEKCNAHLDSVRTVINQLDKIAETVLKKP